MSLKSPKRLAAVWCVCCFAASAAAQQKPQDPFNVEAREYEPTYDAAYLSKVDYDMWLGPAPWHAYNANRVHYNFRFFWDYSGGQMTNFGAHHLDIAQWGLGMDESGPVSIEGAGTFPKDKDLCEVNDTCKITYTYGKDRKSVV